MPFHGFEGLECPEAVTVAVLPMWLVFVRPHCCVAPAWRVLYAPGHVIAPEREARFVGYHALAAVFSDFPLRSGNFGGI